MSVDKKHIKIDSGCSNGILRQNWSQIFSHSLKNDSTKNLQN